MALGHQAHGQDKVELILALRKEVREAHTLDDVTNNLYSVPELVQAGYIPIFERDEMVVYDARNTKIKVSRATVLSGYYHEGTWLWRTPLVRGATADDIPTLETKSSPQDILRDAPPPPTEHIGSVYEIKAQPELVRYYHAAAGFPTKLTWLKAIKNGQFSTWPGLKEAAVRRSFPE